MVNINYYYRSRKESSSLTVRFRFQRDGKRVCIDGKTQKHFDKKYWDKYHQNDKIRDYTMKVMKNESHKHLNDLTSFLDEAYTNVNSNIVNKDWLEKQIDFFYNPELKKNIPLDLIGYITFYLNSRKNSIGKESIKKYQTLEKKIRNFNKKRNKIIMMKDIDENLKLEFEDFQINDEYSTNTINRDVIFLKTLCIHAKEQELTINNQALKMKTKKDNTDDNVIVLNKAEIEKIKRLRGLSNNLEKTRQWLIISCYTGQRISDFMRFEKIMMKNIGDKKIIEIKQQKGKKHISIPILSEVESILNLNLGNFPEKMSHQKYNAHLKKLCELAEINQTIYASKLTKRGDKKYRRIKGYYPKCHIVSSHMGRRTFATMFYGILPTSFLMQITGHCSEGMLLKYIGKTNQEFALESFKYLN